MTDLTKTLSVSSIDQPQIVDANVAEELRLMQASYDDLLLSSREYEDELAKETYSLRQDLQNSDELMKGHELRAKELQTLVNSIQSEKERLAAKNAELLSNKTLLLSKLIGVEVKLEEYQSKIRENEATIEDLTSKYEDSLEKSIIMQETGSKPTDGIDFDEIISDLETQVNELRDQLTNEEEEKKKLMIQISEIASRPIPQQQQHPVMMNDDELRRCYDRERRHNSYLLERLQAARGNMMVCCRIRPPTNDEREILAHTTNDHQIVADSNFENELLFYDHKVDTWRSYQYDRVWQSSSTQDDVFVDIESFAFSVMNGYNVCILGYGQTGSGKTHTLIGHDRLNDGVCWKIIDRMFDMSSSSTTSFLLSMVEIYNQDVVDLLTQSQPSCNLREDRDHRIIIEGASKVAVTDKDQVRQHYSYGNHHRATGKNNVHDRSSRSHLILILELPSAAKLYIVDLAGSERLSHDYGPTQTGLTETRHINKSLSCLGNVMIALDQRQSHVPYRDSKLTYLLQDALSGKCRCLFLITISPTCLTSDESQSTLAFGQRVKRIQFVPTQLAACKNTNRENRNADLQLKNMKRDLDVSNHERCRIQREYDELSISFKSQQENADRQHVMNMKLSDDRFTSLSMTISSLTCQIETLNRQLVDSRQMNASLCRQVDELNFDLTKTEKDLKRENDGLRNMMESKERDIIELKKSYANFRRSHQPTDASSMSPRDDKRHKKKLYSNTLTSASRPPSFNNLSPTGRDDQLDSATTSETIDGLDGSSNIMLSDFTPTMASRAKVAIEKHKSRISNRNSDNRSNKS